MRKLESLTSSSLWNFENKFLLLKAEFHFSNGDFVTAREAYTAAVKSARDHKFVNEEAVAAELAGYFEAKMGHQEEAVGLFMKSMECYDKWGAIAKSELMKRYLEKTFGHFNIPSSRLSFN